MQLNITYCKANDIYEFNPPVELQVYCIMDIILRNDIGNWERRLRTKVKQDAGDSVTPRQISGCGEEVRKEKVGEHWVPIIARRNTASSTC